MSINNAMISGNSTLLKLKTALCEQQTALVEYVHEFTTRITLVDEGLEDAMPREKNARWFGV